MKIVQPKFKKKSYTCPYCNTLSQHYWSDARIYEDNDNDFCLTTNPHHSINTISLSTCNCCKNYEVWYGAEMLIPDIIVVPLPVDDMPPDVKEIYNEARQVYKKSSKAAAALLRLALQHLCKYLGGDGKNINKDIKKLVEGGLDSRIQKSLDILRITGNNAVHPGELDINDNVEIAFKLFKLMNFIVDKMITEPKEIDDFFEDMPEGAKNGVKNRDS